MQYHIFKEKGLIIGSGAIESAHKDVLQKRLKLSGQRWTKKGLQQIAQLRAAYKSGKWDYVKDLCTKKSCLSEICRTPLFERRKHKIQ